MTGPTPQFSPRISKLATWLGLSIVASGAFGQQLALDRLEGLTLHNSLAEVTTLAGKPGLRLMADPAVAKSLEPQFQKIVEDLRASGERPNPAAFESVRSDHLAIVDGVDFGNGEITVEVAGSPAPGRQEGARGFVGVAFRVQGDRRTYDCFYLRPTNGRAEDQERRNHSAQYISHPDWTWYRLRRETPSRYETYVDIGPDEWIQLRITVEGEQARLYVNGAKQPTLVVNDLKTGAEATGKVALWIESTTIGTFRNLEIQLRK